MSFDNDGPALLRPGQKLARVSAGHGERVRITLNGGMDALLLGAVAHLAASPAEFPVVGDWVAARPVEPELALIERVIPRRSKISRRAAGRRDEEQVLAANVDLALIVCGLDGDFNLRRLERYLAIAYEGGVQPVIVLNKADLHPDSGAAAGQVRQIAGRAAVLVISAQTGCGFEAIAALLRPGVTAVLLGSSGAGKSTILNRILGAEAHKTAPARESDSRGRHTTTHRELIDLASGAALIDTPGLREIQIVAGDDSLTAVFDDIAELAVQCRFADCSHSSEPGCAVRGAVDSGRLASFQKLRREAARAADPRAEKQRWRSIHKAARRLYKERDEERGW
ncbi:MAG TPA: ribosome small subunit-dependent GTPase A [Bryobacteraceae bacterium]|nr:ribosome small subunit-dependent GTPase A [Bryobacteraceae bacterium]